MAICKAHKCIRNVTLVVLFACCYVNVKAGSIAYTWTDTIHKNPGYTDDPWDIGQAGKYFQAKLFVNTDEPDQLAESNSEALFPVALTQIIIGDKNVVVEIVENPTNPPKIQFLDISDGTRFPRLDLIIASVRIQLNNYSESVELSTSLAGTTFTLAEAKSPPPLFEPINLSARLFSYSAWTHYHFSNYPTSHLTSSNVPEPVDLLFSVVMILSCCLGRSFRYDIPLSY